MPPGAEGTAATMTTAAPAAVAEAEEEEIDVNDPVLRRGTGDVLGSDEEPSADEGPGAGEGAEALPEVSV